MAMRVVHCPGCQQGYRISRSVRLQADGWFRCGACKQIFHLESAPQKTFMAGTLPQILQPDMARQRKVYGGLFLRRLGGAAILLLLLGLLFFQAAIHWQHPLLQAERPRWVAHWWCRHFECRLPPRRDVEKIALVGRQIHTHPNRQDGLILRFTLINQADYAQPFPLLFISMADRQGSVVASRMLAPEDYRSDAVPLQAGRLKTVVLELRDPGRQAETFEIDFF